MKISINSTIDFEAGSNETIFLAAQKNQITINHSCLNGKCSACKAKVVSGEFNMPSNQEGLSNKEVKDGFCLLCITKPNSDLVLKDVRYFDGILPQVKNIPAKIAELKFLSNDVAKVTLRTPPNNQLKFIAGQYVNLSAKNIKRSYSIASSPSNFNLEFIIKNYPNGQFSNYLFKQARINDLIRIEGPKGMYIFPKHLEQNVIFLSSGTGIAPNISLLKNALENEIVKPHQITLIHGQRKVSEHIYHGLINHFKDIKVIWAISRENSEGYFKGHVQDALLEQNYDLGSTQVFACGNPNMILEARQVLLENGLSETNFKSDAFIESK